MNQNELNFSPFGVCQSHSSLLTTVATQTNELLLDRTSPIWAGFVNTSAAAHAYVPVGTGAWANNFTIGTTVTSTAAYTLATSAYTSPNSLFIAETGATTRAWKNTLDDINPCVFATSNHLNITGRSITNNFLFKNRDCGVGITSCIVTLPVVTGGINYLSSEIVKDYSSVFCAKPSNNFAFVGGTGITIESLRGTKSQTSFALASANPTASIPVNTGSNLFGTAATKVTETISSLYLNQPPNFFDTTNSCANSFIVGSQGSVLGWLKDTKQNLYTGLSHSAATIKSTIAPAFTAGKELIGLMNQLKDNVNVDHFGFDYDTEYSGSNVIINFHFHLTVNNISGAYAHIGNNIYNRLK